MRKLRQLSLVVILTLTLATWTFAGIIGTGPEPPPAPSPTATETISPSLAQPDAPATDPVLVVMLDLMQSALSLL
jgi:hypothetical protein